MGLIVVVLVVGGNGAGRNGDIRVTPRQETGLQCWGAAMCTCNHKGHTSKHTSIYKPIM